ncbi:MAG: hypothetical protein LBE35_07895 [Clostridiales bacterium]|jgi:sugar lactone lactonase YvrE|nr:hypothetical protein [Clostridiales bacterium]
MLREFLLGLLIAVFTFVGTGSHGANDGIFGQFNLPRAIFSGPDGEIFVVDTFNNLLRRVDIIEDLCDEDCEEDCEIEHEPVEEGEPRRFRKETETIAGNILMIDHQNFPRGFYRDGPLENALFNRPTDGIIDSEGRILIVDSQNHAIRIIIGENVFTFAGGNGAGHKDGHVDEAEFNRPTSIAMDEDGNLFITDSGNDAVRKIDTEGEVSTIAEGFNYPTGIAINSEGVIFVSDTGNHKIRMIQDGEISTLSGRIILPEDVEWLHDGGYWDDEPIGGFADGPADYALFDTPTGLAFWNDKLIIADTANHKIRAIITDDYGYKFAITLAGVGHADYINDIPEAAAFHLPMGVYVFEDTLFIADTGNNMIRALPLDAEIFEIEEDEEDEE